MKIKLSLLLLDEEDPIDCILDIPTKELKYCININQKECDILKDLNDELYVADFTAIGILEP